ncbi:ubiquitin carboxyl-terminal hydrolase MINDY-3 [Cocos nucifera]|nr:ubiquitin carboxyl-terminal hydrolase MINDY-3 [Cocos nucifera]
MADREDEELQMALQMSLQSSPPEAKRSKPRESPEESVEARNRRLQRELLASAAEKRIRAMAAVENKSVSPARPVGTREETVDKSTAAATGPAVAKAEVGGPLGGKVEEGEPRGLDSGEELSPSDADQLFLMAYVLKYLLFFPADLGKLEADCPLYSLGQRRFYQSSFVATDNFASITDEMKERALVHSMVEILFLCGSGKRAVVATLGVLSHHADDGSKVDQNEMVTKALEGLSIESAPDLQKFLRVNEYTSWTDAFHHLIATLPVFRSRMGAILFLISALLSRGLVGSTMKRIPAENPDLHLLSKLNQVKTSEIPESIQEDRDDPSLPLVTAPFGHASQEIVNLLLCGRAVANVFDGRMDLGGGMFLKGIPTNVEVGFLSLLESLNFCKVGQFLKCPKWPIWVVGSESHYTVLFALDPAVQEENELEVRASKIRRAFDAQDQSGGGGFISVEGFHQVLRETSITMPSEKLENLCCTGFIVWSEFWQALLDLDKSMGGFKDSSGSMGKKLFDIYHFNGIAKSVSNGNSAAGGENPLQRPRLCKLSVSVPPRWTQEEFLADVVTASSSDPSGKESGPVEVLLSWHPVMAKMEYLQVLNHNRRLFRNCSAQLATNLEQQAAKKTISGRETDDTV